MSQIELESKFEKINLEEGPSKAKDDSSATKCECKKLIAKALEHSNTGSSLKVKDRKKNLIKPARLKIIGTCWARKSKSSILEESTSDKSQVPSTSNTELDDFASEAFVNMRISSNDVLTHSASSPTEEKDGKTSLASQPNSCSAQAKLQQQFSSSEFDSTIDEMSEFLAYHLILYPQDKNFLVNSMYT